MTEPTKDISDGRSRLSDLQQDCVDYLRAHAGAVPCRLELPSLEGDTGTVFITFAEVRRQAHNYLFNPASGAWEPFRYLTPGGAVPGFLALNKWGAVSQVLVPHDGPRSGDISIDSPDELADYILFCRDPSCHLGLSEVAVEIPIQEIFVRLGLPVREDDGRYSMLDLLDASATSGVSPSLEGRIFQSIRNGKMTTANSWCDNAAVLLPLWRPGDREYAYQIRDASECFEVLAPGQDLGSSRSGICAWVRHERVSPLYLRECFRYTTEGCEVLNRILQADSFDALHSLVRTHRVSVPESLAVQRRTAVEWYFSRRALLGACGELRRHPRPAAKLLPDYQRLLAMLRLKNIDGERR